MKEYLFDHGEIMIDYIEIYTDGACSGNPGPGGWGVFLKLNEETFILSGYGGEMTTNNRMELMAVIEGLKSLREIKSKIKIYSDSRYVIDGFKRSFKWKENNWITSSKSPVKNQDLWLKLHEVTSDLTLEWNWVKGHSDILGNIFADKLARDAIVSDDLKENESVDVTEIQNYIKDNL